jgi:hypothetical protein
MTQPTLPSDEASDFKRQLTALINRHSMENSSNTPDFILARYLGQALRAFDEATIQRDQWYGISPQPGGHR